uniref:Uncharacterized protein n=1 Tax=Spironucleus salmonicida TaxID=348837 RepID=V6LGH8_9EUKA|eukprot:EST43403.1 Hypothetical protein SS50377_16898 [Spironucleus salmonicida]
MQTVVLGSILQAAAAVPMHAPPSANDVSQDVNILANYHLVCSEASIAQLNTICSEFPLSTQFSPNLVNYLYQSVHTPHKFAIFLYPATQISPYFRKKSLQHIQILFYYSSHRHTSKTLLLPK